MPAAFGRRYLLPPLLEFQRRHPQVELDVHLSEDKVDVLAGRFDLVVRGGELVSSSLVARRLCGFRVILAAAPAYMQRHGTPTTPRDLADHACLRYSGNRHPGRWRLPVDGVEVTVEVGGPLVSNDLDLLVQGAIEGLGVLCLPDFLLVPHLVDGSLVPLLPGCARTEAFYLVTPHRAPVPARVSRLSAHLVEATRGWDWSLNQSQPRGAPAPQA